MRERPHSVTGGRGEPPAHVMLAAYRGNTFAAQDITQPCHGLCVITTQRDSTGDVRVLVWQYQNFFPCSEGMTFDLLDSLDGNVPAVMTWGVLRVDEFGSYPDAPEEVHRLWACAEACFSSGHSLSWEVQQMVKEGFLADHGDWLRCQNQWQEQQQQVFRQCVLEWQSLQALQKVPEPQTSTAVPISRISRKPKVTAPGKISTADLKQQRKGPQGVRKQRHRKKARKVTSATPSPSSC